MSQIGRATQGVRVMDLDKEDQIVAVARIPERDEDENGDAEGSDRPDGEAPEELEDLHDAGELGTEEFYDRLLEHVRDLMKPRR